MLRRIVLIQLVFLMTTAARGLEAQDAFRADYQQSPTWLCTTLVKEKGKGKSAAKKDARPTWRRFESHGDGISCDLGPRERYFKHDITEWGSVYRVAVVTSTDGYPSTGLKAPPWPGVSLTDLTVEADLRADFLVNDVRGPVDLSTIPEVSLNFWVLLQDPSRIGWSASYVLTKQPVALQPSEMTHVRIHVSNDMSDWTCVSPKGPQSGCLEPSEFTQALSLDRSFGFVLYARGKIDRDPVTGSLTIGKMEMRHEAASGTAAP